LEEPRSVTLYEKEDYNWHIPDTSRMWTNLMKLKDYTRNGGFSIFLGKIINDRYNSNEL
jgi:hypothetical protein